MAEQNNPNYQSSQNNQNTAPINQLDNNSANNPQSNNQQLTTKDEKIGYHKGALSTLLAERNELLRIVSITEQLIQAHLKELESLGIKVVEQKNQ